MKEQLLGSLYDIIYSSTSIKLHVDRVEELRNQLEDLDDFTDEERITLNNVIKNKVQQEAEIALNNQKGGAVLMATGTGKSKIVINRIKPDGLRRLIVVPTVKLRDVTWRDEFYKWNKQQEWTMVKTVCYDSLAGMIGEDEYDEVYLDEGHNITPASAEFFKNVKVRAIIMLTATPPESEEKKAIYRTLGIYPAYTISLEEAVKLGLVAPYDITIITTKMDNTDKCIKAGNKAKPFMQTEWAAYKYISSRIGDEERAQKMDKIKRMRLIYDSKSKLKAAKWILANIIPKESRTIIFAGGIEHAVELCEHRYFSKPAITKNTTDARKEVIQKIQAVYRGDTDLIKFEKGEINWMSCVDSLNEGANVENLDFGFIAQLASRRYRFRQRLGRTVRFRPGHIGKVIVLALEETVDILWAQNAMVGINPAKIRVVKLADLQSGKETISFT